MLCFTLAFKVIYVVCVCVCVHMVYVDKGCVCVCLWVQLVASEEAMAIC